MDLAVNRLNQVYQMNENIDSDAVSDYYYFLLISLPHPRYVSELERLRSTAGNQHYNRSEL